MFTHRRRVVYIARAGHLRRGDLPWEYLANRELQWDPLQPVAIINRMHRLVDHIVPACLLRCRQQRLRRPVV